MKKIHLVRSVLFALIFSTMHTLAAPTISTLQGVQVSKKTMLHITTESMFLMQTITKDYLYLSTDTESTLLTKEMQHALLKLDKNIAKLDTMYSRNAQVEQLLGRISLGRDELRSILEEPYSTDNMKLVLEVTGLISEAAWKITYAVENDSIVYKRDSNILMPRLSSL
jgi:hypothetical protein